MASTFESKLPPELRLEIYSHVLRSDYPLKQAPTTPTSSGSIAALLAVNEKIYEEAIDTLYKNNTFTFHLTTLCHERTGTAARDRLFSHPYRHLRITTDTGRLPCGAPCLLKLLADLKDTATAPNISTITVLLQHGGVNLDYFRMKLDQLGQTVKFTSVGSFKITALSSNRHFKITVEYPAMIEAWSYLASVRPVHQDYCMGFDRLHWVALHSRVRRKACGILCAYYEEQLQPLGKESRESCRDVLAPWADSAHTAEEYEGITEVLAPLV